MNVLALCAGIGGLELGLKIANPAARCVCYVEGEAYAAAILVKRMGEGWLDEAPVWSDVRTFDGCPWRGEVDCITGGYPCQPFSIAGQKLGEQDERHLFPDIRRIIGEVQPERCFFENVAGHLSLGFEAVANDLQEMGYRVAAGLFTAEEVGATHKRERVFIMAHSLSRIGERPRVDEGDGKTRSLDRKLGRGSCHIPLFPPGRSNISAWKRHYPLPVESTIRGMADGRSDRADRLRAAGNAVVPLVAAYAWRTLHLALQS
jgi:DNA (cytosine-5)-methyltransferase 1